MRQENISELFESARLAPTELSEEKVRSLVNGLPVLLAALPWWKLLTTKFKLMMSFVTITTITGISILTLNYQNPEITSNEHDYTPRQEANILVAQTGIDETEKFPFLLASTAERDRTPALIAEESTPKKIVSKTQETARESPEKLKTRKQIKSPGSTSASPSARKAPIDDKQFDLSGFTRIDLQTFADVVIHQGPFNVRADGSEELLETLLLEVEQNTLIITNVKNKKKNKIKSSESVVVTISMPTIEVVELSGFGNIKMDSFTDLSSFGIGVSGFGDFTVNGPMDINGNLKIDLSGYGNIKMSGSTDHLASCVSGYGNLNAEELKARKINAKHSGFGKSKLYCSESLDITHSGFGDVKVYGQPSEKTINNSGFGSVKIVD